MISLNLDIVFSHCEVTKAFNVRISIERMPITIPKFFEDLLQNDRSLRAGVDAMVVAFDAWLSTSRLPFFVDYTDHGVEHLNCVLATADYLIAPASRNLFTPGDAAVLILATLLHDSAMHLSEAGFYQLVRGDAAEWNIPEFPGPSWPSLWNEFLFSAKRWDNRQIKDVLGETPSGELRAQVTDPFSSYDNLTDSDRKLIGEFIRRHHPRMAHEFARYGVPGRTLINHSMLLSTDIYDIAGMVARSHGLPVRTCIDYIQRKYHRREYKGIHAVFLMTLLRISDYLQIQPGRAPDIVFKYRHIPSKFSKQEWEAHNAVVNITQTHDDPESLEIQAIPQDVNTYLRLKDWLSGIQRELDASWSVLGETYGSHTTLSNLELILRRVRSNLDDVDTFAQQVAYVPEKVEIQMAGPALLRLLVGPLYNDVPSIGIRELLQNAIDAIRERWFLEEKHVELKDAPLIEQYADIHVLLESKDKQGNSWLTISDRGVGMSVETVRDYFLTVGASFRKSSLWQQEFETDNALRSQVLRSGKFGIGVLAGFLLGDRLEVSSRYIGSKTGIRFVVTQEPEVIELHKDSTLRVGTTIRILVSSDVRKKLYAQDVGTRKSEHVARASDWFIYDRPSIIYAGFDFPMHGTIRPPDTPPLTLFRRIRRSYGYIVHWTYASIVPLSVNGIWVPQRRIAPRLFPSESVFDAEISFEFPNICVSDPDGAFPLNLRRDGVTETSHPYVSQLGKDVIDDFFAYLLVHCPNDGLSGNLTPLLQYPGITSATKIVSGTVQVELKYLIAYPKGITLCLPALIPTSKSEVLYFILPDSEPAVRALPTESDYVVSFIKKCDVNYLGNERRWPYSIPDRLFLGVLQVGRYLRLEEPELDATPYKDLCSFILGTKAHINSVRYLLPTRIARRVIDSGSWASDVATSYSKSYERDTDEQMVITLMEQAIREVCEGLVIEKEFGGHALVAPIGCPETRLSLRNLNKKRELCLLEVFLSSPTSNVDVSKPGTISKRWKKVVRKDIIPFNIETRRTELKNAYKVLEPFIVFHEAAKQEHDSI